MDRLKQAEKEISEEDEKEIMLRLKEAVRVKDKLVREQIAMEGIIAQLIGGHLVHVPKVNTINPQAEERFAP